MKQLNQPDVWFIPLKFNMEPENLPEKELPFGKPSFSGSMLNFGGVSLLPQILLVSVGRENVGIPRLRTFAGANRSYPSFGFSQFGMWGS